MRISYLAVIILLSMIFKIPASEPEDINPLTESDLKETKPVFRDYRSFHDIYPLGLQELDPEGTKEPEKFKHRNEFILWISQLLLDKTAISGGIGFSTNYSNILSENEYLKNLQDNDFYNYYSNSLLKELLGISGSWFLDFKIAHNLWLQPELKYHHYNSHLILEDIPIENYNKNDYLNKLDVKVDMHYLNFPILLRYGVSHKKDSSLYLLIGPSLNIFVSGNAKWKYIHYLENGNNEIIETASMELEDIKNLSISMNSSIGLSYLRFFLELRLENCLSNMNELNFDKVAENNGKVERFLFDAYDYQKFQLSMNLGYKLGRKWLDNP